MTNQTINVCVFIGTIICVLTIAYAIYKAAKNKLNEIRNKFEKTSKEIEWKIFQVKERIKELNGK